MKRNLMLAVAISAVVLTNVKFAANASPQQDFSQIDPVWAAGVIDQSLRSGPLGSAWIAMKEVFPGGYHQLMLDIANFAIHHQDSTVKTRDFVRDHVTSQIQNAQRAPAVAQAEYQREKADFLMLISNSNVEACAKFSNGELNLNIATNLNDYEMKHFSQLIAAEVRAIGAGLKSPTTYDPLTPADVSVLKSILASRGFSEADQKGFLAGTVGETPAEICHAGVVRNSVFAAAPAEIVAKVAFR